MTRAWLYMKPGPTKSMSTKAVLRLDARLVEPAQGVGALGVRQGAEIALTHEGGSGLGHGRQVEALGHMEADAAQRGIGLWRVEDAVAVDFRPGVQAGVEARVHLDAVPAG
jgi:hypothetical protein